MLSKWHAVSIVRNNRPGLWFLQNYEQLEIWKSISYDASGSPIYSDLGFLIFAYNQVKIYLQSKFKQEGTSVQSGKFQFFRFRGIHF